jgi:hypothetical protein
MCPKGLTSHHPAAFILNKYTTLGCTTLTGTPWTKADMWEVVARGPHCSALLPEAIEHFWLESIEKVKAGQAIQINWDDIKDNPPP